MNCWYCVGRWFDIYYSPICSISGKISAITLAQALKATGVDLVLYDPLIAMDQTTVELAITNMLPENKKYDAVILAVGHDQFAQMDLLGLLTEKGFGYDIKAYFDIHPRIYRL